MSAGVALEMNQFLHMMKHVCEGSPHLLQYLYPFGHHVTNALIVKSILVTIFSSSK